jgi:phosphomannomutase
VDLTQLEIYLNALAELEYLQSLSLDEGGIQQGDPFYFAYDLRPSSSEFVRQEQGRGEIAQAIVAAIGDAGMNSRACQLRLNARQGQHHGDRQPYPLRPQRV